MNILKQWEETSNEIAGYFKKKYFGRDATEYYWISDEIGGVYVINDYFFDLSDMVNFIKYKYNIDDMFAYYDYDLKEAEKGKEGIVNIQNWKKLKGKK